MSTLKIQGLCAEVAGKEILRGIDLEVNSGEVHAIMGPNGAGKSTLSAVIMGKPGYTVTAGSVTLDGVDMLALPTWKRATAGLHLVMQYPTEVPGVHVDEVLMEALSARGRSGDDLAKRIAAEASRINFDTDLVSRALNVDLSGGEKKRHEIMQLELLKPKFAILDETDSGLDVDALRIVSEGVVRAKAANNHGILLITHYTRILKYIKPDFVHVFANGRIVEEGGPELADKLEAQGYAEYVTA